MKIADNIDNIANAPDSPRLVVFHIPTHEEKEDKENIIDMSTNTEYDYEEDYKENKEDSKLILDETNMRILITMNNKIEKMSIRVKQILDKNTGCLDCLCRCFSCTSFILSILSLVK
jgi:hypothetical protein